MFPVLFLAGCATPQASVASSSGAGAAVSSGPTLIEERPLSVPRRARTTDAVDLVLRPDVITADFAVRELRATSSDALTAARQTFTGVTERLSKWVGRPVRVSPRGVVAEPMAKGVAVTVDGGLEFDLPAELDFWGRSQFLTAIQETTAALAISLSSPGVSALRFEGISPGVKNPELYRPLLVERWVAQARGFASQAQTQQAPLVLVDCAPPGSVTQVFVSVEEVRLQLAVSCRIDVPPAPARLDEPVTTGSR